MKKIELYIILLLDILLIGSCTLDNYDAPNAKFYGSILDNETNEPIEQDIISGSQIEYTEHGFDNPTVQYMTFKTDGTFRNNLMFAGTYTFTPVRGNFVPVEPKEIEIQGDTKYDFVAQPYIRVKNASIQIIGTKVVATFNLQQTVTNNVSRIGLYAHLEPSVGQPMRVVAAEKNINAVTNESTLYTLEIDLPSNVTKLVPGKQYFFRIGALITASEAKYNYAPAVRLSI